jgi:hypothetical protein
MSFTRSERQDSNYSTLSAFGSLSGPMQPSTLGFVAKQEMPHHLSILFRAR